MNTLRLAPLSLLFVFSLLGAIASASAQQLAQSTAEDESEEQDIPLLDDGVTPADPEPMTAKKPAPEYPQPGAAEPGFRTRGPITEVPPPTPNPALPRPARITEDGQYIYDTSVPPERHSSGALPPPRGTHADGSYDYDAAPKPALPPDPIPDVERPTEVTAHGYQYKTESSKEIGAVSLRFGFIAPPSIVNKKTNSTFRQIYGDSAQGALMVDYEWRVLRDYGRVGLKFGTGLISASGTGRFVDSTVAANWTPEEQFTFIVLPNTLTLSYRFQYSRTQFIIPFVEGGPGYFTFMEIRDDNKAPKFGGSPVAVAAGGLLLSLNFLDRGAINRLDTDYGINNIYLSTELRAIAGLSSTTDFSSTVINAGIVADF